MKANETPEKIYISPLPNPSDGYVGVAWDESHKTTVEYTCTDVFIEKALKWYCLDCACNDNCAANHKCAFWSFFKDYLEGNEKALPPKIGNAFNPDGSTTENYRYRHIIERIQDDFVEKAISWLKEQNEIIGVSFQKDFLERFKNYMTGE